MADCNNRELLGERYVCLGLVAEFEPFVGERGMFLTTACLYSERKNEKSLSSFPVMFSFINF